MLGTKFDDPVQSSTYLSVLILKNHQTFRYHFICSDLYFPAIFCLSHLAGSAQCFHVHSKAHILSVCHKVSFLSKTSKFQIFHWNFKSSTRRKRWNTCRRPCTSGLVLRSKLRISALLGQAHEGREAERVNLCRAKIRSLRKQGVYSIQQEHCEDW